LQHRVSLSLAAYLLCLRALIERRIYGRHVRAHLRESACRLRRKAFLYMSCRWKTRGVLCNTTISALVQTFCKCNGTSKSNSERNHTYTQVYTRKKRCTAPYLGQRYLFMSFIDKRY